MGRIEHFLIVMLIVLTMLNMLNMLNIYKCVYVTANHLSSASHDYNSILTFDLCGVI